MRNRVSIVTITYNSSSNISKLLASLLECKEFISEVIVIENNSPEKKETELVCREYTNRLNIKFTLNSNVGFGKSCNMGAKTATSDLILFLNPDTELQKNSLKILLNHAAKCNADIIGGKAINFEGKIHGSVVRAPKLFIGLFEFTNLGKIFNIKKAHKLFYYEDNKLLESKIDRLVDAVSGAYLLISKKAFSKLNGFDENIFMYLEDIDLGKRANELGMKVVFCPHSIIWHIGGASSKNKYKIRHQAWFDSRKYYFKKHLGLFGNIIIQPIFFIEEFLLKKFKSL